jgi:NAD+ synthetase
MIHSINVAIGQIRPRKGDYAENLRRIGGSLAKVAELEVPPALVVFPETFVSGYFLQGGVRELAVTAGGLFEDLAEQHERSGAGPLDVVVGFYEHFQNRVFNSALYASLGGTSPRIVHVHRKVFLPTYGLFDEKRFVQEGHEIKAFDTRWGRVAMVVCEDIWHSIIPTLAALDGAQVIIVPSAGPARGIASTDQEGTSPGSVWAWESRVRGVAIEHGVYVVLAQLVGSEGGKSFQGSSAVVAPDGTVVARGPVLEDAIVTATLSPDVIARTRVQQPFLGDIESKIDNLLLARTRPATLRFDSRVPNRTEMELGVPGRAPVIGAVALPDPMEIAPQLAEAWLESFLRDEVTVRRGFDRVLVGLSGGVDSAVTAALAAKAFGPSNVIGVRMPYRTSSDESLEHAEEVARPLGIELRTVEISDAVDGYARAVGDDLDATRRGNVMARVRMITLFDLSAKLHALPLGTGNKTERLLGYFTWHADDAPPVNPIGDLFKTQVRMLARHLNIPEAVIEKPASADLIPGQTDEADLGVSYDEADHILHWILNGYHDDAIMALGFSAEAVAVVRRRLDTTHWKRHLPTVAVVSDTAIGEGYLRPVDY